MKISCCKNFSHPIYFGPTLWEGLLPKENLTILIHGYHSPEKEAESSYKEIEKNLDRGWEGWVEYYWPGGAIALDFPLAVQRATEAGWRLRDLLNSLNVAKIYPDVQTHSLGARVILEALKYKDISINNLIMSAPAIDYDSLYTGKEFEESINWCKTINIFYSKNDPVLRKDYPLSPTNLGHIALGTFGPQKLDGFKLFDYSNLVNTHGGYRFCSKYYEDWKKIVNG